MNSNSMKRKWLVQAPLGLVLVGAGLCMTIDAAFLKNTGEPWPKWVTYGTFSLTVFNAGLSLFVDSVIHRIRYLMNK